MQCRSYGNVPAIMVDKDSSGSYMGIIQPTSSVTVTCKSCSPEIF